MVRRGFSVAQTCHLSLPIPTPGPRCPRAQYNLVCSRQSNRIASATSTYLQFQQEASIGSCVIHHRFGDSGGVLGTARVCLLFFSLFNVFDDDDGQRRHRIAAIVSIHRLHATHARGFYLLTQQHRRRRLRTYFFFPCMCCCGYGYKKTIMILMESLWATDFCKTPTRASVHHDLILIVTDLVTLT